MFFRLGSDLHMEFSTFELPHLDTDKDDVLVLAGDIGVANAMTTFDPVIEWASRFRKVIQICGNHEFYNGSLLRVRTKLIEKYDGIDNLIHAERDIVRVDNVSFVCATLWTDFYRENPVVMEQVRRGLNDYNFIRTGPSVEDAYIRKINPTDILNEHKMAKKFIFKAIRAEKEAGQKVVVVSHHAPSELSIDFSKYGNDPINWAYASDLSNEILDTQPQLWVHGHVHATFNYMVGETNVRTNPRGYAYPNGPCENGNFDPTLRIEV